MNRIDGELKEMTALAMPELKRHDKQRVRGWQSSLMEFSNDQVCCPTFCFVSGF